MTRKEVAFMSIVKYKNQSGVTYAYEQTSVYNAEKKQSRPVRKYLGRVDPETGEIISTKGKRGRPKQTASDTAGESTKKDYKALYESKCMELEKVAKDLSTANVQKERLASQVQELKSVLSSIRTQVMSVKEL